MSVEMIDCATKLNSSTSAGLKRSGVKNVGRYLPTSAWKGLTVGEVQTIKAAGLNIISIYETVPTKRSYFSYARGISDAKHAAQLAETLKQPHGSAIYFTADYDAQQGDLDEIREYLKGIKATLKDYKIGLYGSFQVVEALHNYADYTWQTYAWSDGKLSQYAAIHQYNNGQRIVGVQLDYDNVRKECGTWGESGAAAKSNKKAIIESSGLLQSGSRGSAVKNLQKALNAAGFSCGAVDGIFGVKTEKAVRKLQSAYHIAIDGIVGPQTKSALAKVQVKGDKSSGKSIVPYPGHLICKGSKGKDVERVQRAVGTDPDGIYGPATVAAVKAYQRRHGLSADGIVGPRTWNVMF